VNTPPCRRDGKEGEGGGRADQAGRACAGREGKNGPAWPMRRRGERERLDRVGKKVKGRPKRRKGLIIFRKDDLSLKFKKGF
jgi:hypothetical protein